MVLTVDEDEIVQRLLQRAELEGRADDTEDVIRRRQEVYAEQTEPLIESTAGAASCVEVDGMGEVDEVTQRIFDALDVVPRADGRTVGLLDRGIEIKTPEQIDVHAPGRPGGGRDPRAAARSAVRAGITTGELDAIAEDNIRSAGATPSFQGYHGFPGSICASVNDEVVHGIPGDRGLAEGDVISIDCGAIVDGWHGDAAITVPSATCPPR